MKSLILSIVTFLITSLLLVLVIAKKQEQPLKPKPEQPPYRLIWSEIPGDPHDYAGQMDIDGKECPPGWQEGWRWNGFIAVKQRCDW